MKKLLFVMLLSMAAVSMLNASDASQNARISKLEAKVEKLTNSFNEMQRRKKARAIKGKQEDEAYEAYYKAYMS